MEGPTVLIFGVNGFVGRHLTEEFASNGYCVYGSDRAPDPKTKGLLRYWSGDVTDAVRTQEICAASTPDVIVNLAAVSSVKASWASPQETIQVNVNGAINILEAVKNVTSSSKVLLVGSSEQYTPSRFPLHEDSPICANNPYGISKMTQERFAEIYSSNYGMKIYRTRSFNHTGLGQSPNFVLAGWCKQVAEIEKAKKAGNVTTGNIDVKRDFTDVADVVSAYRMIVESNYWNEIFNVGSGKAYSLREVLSTICSFSSQEIQIDQRPELLRPVDNDEICSDCSKIKKLIGWKPKNDIREVLKTMYDSYLYT